MRPIIVLGAERSGTSVLAEMIVRWGAYPGAAHQLKGPDEHSPRGYWEYLPLWDLLAEIGDFTRGVSWWDASFEDHLRGKLQNGPCRRKALDLVASMASAGRPWVWKGIWEDAAYVVAVRHPRDVAVSWQRWAAPGLPEGRNLVRPNLLRWQYMMLRILEHTEDARERLLVRYEEVIQRPAAEATRLGGFLSRVCGHLPPGDAEIRGMADVVAPGQWRNRCPTGLAEVAEATEAQRELYGFLRGLDSGRQGRFEAGTYPLPSNWREVVDEGQAVARRYREATAGCPGTMRRGPVPLP